MPYKPPSIKALARKFGEYLSNVWSYLPYYRHDPSKPSKAAFLKLTHDEHEAWIEANIPDYKVNLYGDNYLGCSYELDEDTLEDYIEYRDDYGLSGIVSSQLPNMTKERLEKIDDGANLTLEEVEALKVGIAENDFDGWQTHSGQYIKVRFGAVYALYVGEDIGQGGVSFELEAVFRSKSKAMLALNDKPMIALEQAFWSAAQDYDNGVEAYNAGDYQTALQKWRPLAEQGDANAQFYLGVMYKNG